MRNNLLTLFVVSLMAVPAAARNKPLKMSLAEYEDRVYAAWLGQIVGALAGFQFEGKVASSPLVWVDRLPGTYQTAQVDDDYYYELVALRGFEKYGINMTLDELGQQWKENSAGSYGSSAETRTQLAAGIPGSQAGHPRYNRFWWTIGPQFSSDTYGMLAPGNPNLAGELARKYGHINGYAEGTDGAVFVAGMVSLAFRESDPKNVVRQAARLIHPSSPYRQCLDLVISMAERGSSPEEIFRAVEDRWRFEYPRVNNAVPNGGLVAGSVWFGEGDYLKSVNLAYHAADFSDADCNAANVGAVVGAMKGVKALPAAMVERLHDRILGARMGRVTLTPPVDEKISDIAHRVVAVGGKLLAAHGAKVSDSEITVPYHAVVTPAAELFRLADLTRFWDKDWTLDRAGFLNNSNGTYLDGAVLVTFPRDEGRGALLRRRIKLGPNPALELEVAADADRAWRLDVFVNNTSLESRTIQGGTTMNELDWQEVRVDLAAYRDQQVDVRLYQRVGVPAKLPSNAHWRGIQIQ